MLEQIRLEDAEKQFKELIRRSVQGDEFVIVINNVPLAKITPFKTEYKRKLGTAKGKIFIKEDFKEIPDGFEDYIS